MNKKAQEQEIATMKKIVFAVMSEAIKRASGDGKYPFSARGLYYQVRPLIQKYTKKELSYEYFTPPLLTEYQELYGEIKGLYYEARGVLIEPHTGREIPLGTREVSAYQAEAWLFNKILYVEKTGLLPILKAAKIGEKYDMALMSSQGFANRSAKELLSEFEREFEEMTILCIHDCDISGHEIARTLAEETRTSKRRIRIIDLGLSVEDVQQWQLETENVYIRQTPPAEFLNRLSRLERRFFLGKKINAHNGTLKGQRCELNAFRPDDLIAFIETKLKSLGLTSKIIPPEEVIKKEEKKSFNIKLREEVTNEVIKRLNIEEIVSSITEELMKNKNELKKEDIKLEQEASWRTVIMERAQSEALKLTKENSNLFDKYL